jgi:hypothetical protein
VLEPSAGYGAIADLVDARRVDCVELNEERRRVLLGKGHNVVGRDFMLFEPAERYDRIVAAPNFRDNVDCLHIRRMYDVCLKRGGRMSSLTSPYWMTGDSPTQRSFRSWLAGKEYHITMLPDGSFMEGGLTVPTAIITLTR